jgi:CheY-like chemotaxis protein
MLDILRPQRIHTGDHIKLGALSMQVHFLIKPSTSDDTMPGFGNDLRIPRIAHGEHLLIVEDNNDISQVVRFIALRAGFQVSVATTLTDAYVQIDNQPVDVLIVELLMAEGSGLPVVDYVRTRLHRPVPIIAIADSSGGYTTGKALAVGVDLNLVKPIAIDELMQNLTKALILWVERSEENKKD